MSERVFIVREAADAIKLEREATAKMLERWGKAIAKRGGGALSDGYAFIHAAACIRRGHHHRRPPE